MPQLTLFTALCLALSVPYDAPAGDRGLHLTVTDSKSGKVVPVRMQITNQRGRTMKVPGVPNHAGWFVFGGEITLKLPVGHYQFQIERGPEYRTRSGYFTIERDAGDAKAVEMQRFVDMKQEGWWSGDMDIRRRRDNLPMHMQAEDLQFGQAITWTADGNRLKIKPQRHLLWTDDGRLYRLLGGLDHRGGGALAYYGLQEPLDLRRATAEFPPASKYLEQFGNVPGVHVDVAEPTSWELPVWVASGKIDTVQIAHSRLEHDRVGPAKPGTRQRDKTRYLGPQGIGRWSLAVYYHLLNCGLRIPPSAGSGSGESESPVGYNRVYVHCGEDFSYERWMDGLRAGRSVVTNGPLLRPRANGHLPGHVFKAAEGSTLEIQISAQLSTKDRIAYFEIVQDGQVAHEVKLADWVAARGKLPPLKFRESGWLLVRAVTENTDTYRYAASAPWYVEIDGRRRIQKPSAQFFLDWVYQRARTLRKNEPQRWPQMMKYHLQARDFFKRLVDSAGEE